MKTPIEQIHGVVAREVMINELAEQIAFVVTTLQALTPTPMQAIMVMSGAIARIAITQNLPLAEFEKGIALTLAVIRDHEAEHAAGLEGRA